VNKIAQMPARQRSELFAETANRKSLPEAIIEIVSLQYYLRRDSECP